MKKVFLCVSLMSLCFVSSAMAGGDAEQGKAKSAVCAACHGVDGNSANPIWPKLAGQHEEFTVRQLTLFKSGARNNAVMAPMVANLSEQDMKDLGAYFASQRTNTGSADENLVELGQSIYQGGIKKLQIPACMSCHGVAGKGNPLSGYPVLAGQHAPYIEQRLKSYRAGEVIEDKDEINGKIMADVAKYLTDDEIKAVASYIQGLYTH